MNQQANVESIQAIADFRAALVEFDRQTRDLLQTLELEVRRAIDWIEHDRTRYWPQQMRRATDAVQEARINLDAAQISVRPDDSRPCYEQKKLLGERSTSVRDLRAQSRVGQEVAENAGTRTRGTARAVGHNVPVHGFRHRQGGCRIGADGCGAGQVR